MSVCLIKIGDAGMVRVMLGPHNRRTEGVPCAISDTGAHQGVPPTHGQAASPAAMAAGRYHLRPGRQRLCRTRPCARLGPARRTPAPCHRALAGRLARRLAHGQSAGCRGAPAPDVSPGLAASPCALVAPARYARPGYRHVTAARRRQPARTDRHASRERPGGAYRWLQRDTHHRRRTFRPVPGSALLRPGQCRGCARDRWMGRPTGAAAGLAYRFGGVAQGLSVRAFRPAPRCDCLDTVPRRATGAAGQRRGHFRAIRAGREPAAATPGAGRASAGRGHGPR